MSRPRVVSVGDGTAAAQAGLAPGDEIISINGVMPRDVIEYQFLVEEPRVELEVQRGQFGVPVIIEKSAGEPLGAEIDAAIFDQVRTCDNHCSFCFIYQLPKGMRKSLYLKDDDYRLSFLYGNFTTLTRFTELDLERVISEKLSPLYVSIHATDPMVRTELLRNQRGSMSLRWLSALLDAGIEVHGQIVVCPGINDGVVLYDTLAGILDEYPKLASVGVVPLGISDYTTEPAMRRHTQQEANMVIDSVHEWQEIFRSTLGHRMVFISDEYYVMTGREFPPANHYEAYAQHENGIGIARGFIDELQGVSDTARGVESGFFAWVDGAPAEGYRAPRISDCGLGGVVLDEGSSHSVNVTRLSLSPSARAPLSLLTGSFGAQIMTPLVPLMEELSGVGVHIVEVENTFFGGNIGVAGLLTGTDIARVLISIPSHHRVLLPDVCLSNGVFLDGMSLDELPRSVEVVGTSGSALRKKLQTRRAA